MTAQVIATIYHSQTDIMAPAGIISAVLHYSFYKTVPQENHGSQSVVRQESKGQICIGEVLLEHIRTTLCHFSVIIEYCI